MTLIYFFIIFFCRCNGVITYNYNNNKNRGSESKEKNMISLLFYSLTTIWELFP
ncbi:hypothetical protein BD770DRAFT_377636 [Pilaira anomala]|nr:hypothetical protein BD770DRAFT_377636 [Pilaira anomala]